MKFSIEHLDLTLDALDKMAFIYANDTSDPDDIAKFLSGAYSGRLIILNIKNKLTSGKDISEFEWSAVHRILKKTGALADELSSNKGFIEKLEKLKANVETISNANKHIEDEVIKKFVNQAKEFQTFINEDIECLRQGGCISAKKKSIYNELIEFINEHKDKLLPNKPKYFN